MTASLSIGDFSRACHLTVKTLRHYHEIELLVPAEVDPHTGYRRYGIDQLPTAQVIRRLRDLDMPLDRIRAVLSAPDPRVRNAHVAAHLTRLEEELGRTEAAIASLRDLLSPAAGTPHDIQLRATPPTPAAAISETVDAEDSALWLRGALGELHATLDAQKIAVAGPAGGLFADDLFTHHRGEATIFLPCDAPVRPMGRVGQRVIPGAELAVITHRGRPSEVDRAYGALAGHVARHALAVDGPIREYYLVGPRDTPDETRWRTEVCWPVFHTAA
ncbi:MAG: MerR family transcriptional regulator [Mycobacteriales bacterium]